MKADIQKAAFALALCLIAVFSVHLFVVSHADHDCTGTGRLRRLP